MNWKRGSAIGRHCEPGSRTRGRFHPVRKFAESCRCANLADLPYIPRVQIMRITDTAFVKAKCRPEKVKSFARLASKPFAITENSCRKPTPVTKFTKPCLNYENTT